MAVFIRVVDGVRLVGYFVVPDDALQHKVDTVLQDNARPLGLSPAAKPTITVMSEAEFFGACPAVKCGPWYLLNTAEGR